MAEEVGTEAPVLPEEPIIKEGRVVYEQDLRAAAHRNGHSDHLLGVAVGDPPPPEPPVEGDDHHDHGDAQPSRVRHIVLGSVYLVAGAVAIYIGITMIRDSGKEKS